MDDDDQKIRRNLVAFSFAVLAMAWLDIPFSVILNKTFGIEAIQSKESSLLALCLSVLVYLGLRYSFSSEGRSYQKAIHQELGNLLREKAIGLAQLQANFFTITGWEPTVFSGNLKGYISERSEGMGTSITQSGRPKILMTLYEIHDGPRNFSVSAELSWFRNGELIGSSRGGNSIAVKMQFVARVYIEVLARVHWLFYSSTSITYMAPAVLSLAASIVLGKLCKSPAPVCLA